MAGGGRIDGCRPDQLFGLWAIEETRFRQMVAVAKAADLAQLRAEARAATKTAPPAFEIVNEGTAVIDLSGPLTKHPTSFQALLGGTSTIRARQALRAAVADREVHSIMLRVDSPGGTVGGLAELVEEIRRAAARKPLHAFADDFAASAGLLALTQGLKVWANPNAEVGSLGVYTVVEDTSQAYAQAGVKVHVISSAPPIKGAGVDGTEITPEQLAEWRRRVDDTAEWFVAEISKGRRLARADVVKLATGQVWIAEQARARGLVDAVATFDEALADLTREGEAVVDAAAAEFGTRLKAATAPPPAATPPAPRPTRSAAEILDQMARCASGMGKTLPDFAFTTALGRALRAELLEARERERPAAAPPPRTAAAVFEEIERRSLETMPGKGLEAFLRTHEGARLYEEYRARQIAEAEARS